MHRWRYRLTVGPLDRSTTSCAALRILMAWAVFQTGCVERRMTIRTNVDDQGGALVMINKREVGVTPVSTGYTYYAPREIRLIKDGYDTATFIQEIPAPWWDSLALEFFVENLLPVTLRDERVFHYSLEPARPVPTEQLLRRARSLRKEAHLGTELVPIGQSAARHDQVNF